MNHQISLMKLVSSTFDYFQFALLSFLCVFILVIKMIQYYFDSQLQALENGHILRLSFQLNTY